jgi:hypothetical protein
MRALSRAYRRYRKDSCLELHVAMRLPRRFISSVRPLRRRQELIEALSQGDPALAGEAMRQHIQAALANALLRLKPYFQMSKELGETYSCSAKRRVQVGPPRAKNRRPKPYRANARTAGCSRSY